MKRYSTEPNRHIVDILFVLTLFGVFAASALMLVTLGANVYKHTVSGMNENFTERTTFSYLTEKLRQNDTYDAVSVEDFYGTPALMLTQRMGEEEFCTCLYLYDGYLKELFVRKNSYAGDNVLAAGQNILELESLELTDLGDGLICLVMDTGNGKPVRIYASLHSDHVR